MSSSRRDKPKDSNKLIAISTDCNEDGVREKECNRASISWQRVLLSKRRSKEGDRDSRMRWHTDAQSRVPRNYYYDDSQNMSRSYKPLQDVC